MLRFKSPPGSRIKSSSRNLPGSTRRPWVRLRVRVADAASAIVFAFTFALAPALPGRVSAEEWTDLRGNRTIEAKMIGMWGDNVVLQLQNGKRVTVNANSLRSESRIQARQLQRELAETRTTRIEELRSRAADAALAAPNPLPKPRPTSAYRPIAAGQKVEPFFRAINDQVRAGHLIAIHDALPPSYRADVKALVTQAAMKIDDSDWQATIGTLHQFGDAIVSHQRWFLSHPRMAQLPTDALETIEGEFLTIADALRVGLSPDTTSLQALQSGEFEKWLTRFDAATADYIAQAYRLSSIDDRTITVVSETADAATVTIGSSGNATTGTGSTITFQNVDGYWVPKSLADTWTDHVAAIKQSIADAPTGTLMTTIRLVTSLIASVTQPMTTASTEAEFHDAMEALFLGSDAIVAAAGQVLGKTFSLAQRSPGNSFPGNQVPGNQVPGNQGGAAADQEDVVRAADELERALMGGQ